MKRAKTDEGAKTEELTDHYVPGLRCAWCGAPADGALNTDPGETEPPEAGDAMVCAYCAQPNEVTVLGLVQLSDFTKLLPEEREGIERAMRVVREAPAWMRVPPSMRGD